MDTRSEDSNSKKLGFFITGTGTGVGKTFFTRGLARAILDQKRNPSKWKPIAAIKPFETGCQPEPQDAIQIADACGELSLATLSDFYRARLPLAPYAASLEGEEKPNFKGILRGIKSVRDKYGITLVEGAGGPLVPLDHAWTLADFVAEIDLPVVLVTQNTLGVLSHTLTAVESLTKRDLQVCAVILNHPEMVSSEGDVSVKTNQKILEQYLSPIPIFSFPFCVDDTAVLSKAVSESGFLGFFSLDRS